MFRATRRHTRVGPDGLQLGAPVDARLEAARPAGRTVVLAQIIGDQAIPVEGSTYSAVQDAALARLAHFSDYVAISVHGVPEGRTRASEICVTDLIGRISTFDALQDGDGPPIRSFGSNTQLLLPTRLAYDATNDEIFVYSEMPRWITVYSGGASGNVAPLRTLQLLGDGHVLGIAVDASNDELYVARAGVIETYGRAASGRASPLRTLSVELEEGGGFAYDPVNVEIYTAGTNGVAVYPRTAIGRATPLRSFTFSAAAGPLAVDAVNDELFVTGQQGNVFVFPRTASGTLVPPTRAITGITQIRALVVDTAHDELDIVAGNIFGSHSPRPPRETPRLSGAVKALRLKQGAVGSNGLYGPGTGI